MLRATWTAVAGICLFCAVGCKRGAPDNVAATVNGRAITYDELNKQYEAQFVSGPEKRSDDQPSIQKLGVLRALIDGQIMLQRAEKEGLIATDTNVEEKLTELKAPFTQEEFQKRLTAQHMTLDDLKTQLRQNLSVDKLINKEITSHISISDKEVEDFYNTNKSSFNFPEPKVHLGEIVVTPAPDPNVRNLKNDKAQNEDQAKRKIEMIAARISQGEDFGMLAQNYSEDPTSAQNGGDLGFIPESALDRANPELRKAVMAMTPGQVSPIVHTPEGYRIFKMIEKESAGQRTLNDPRVQQSIRETLINRKDQLLKNAFYEVARDEAKVVNYYAQSVLRSYAQKSK